MRRQALVLFVVLALFPHRALAQGRLTFAGPVVADGHGTLTLTLTSTRSLPKNVAKTIAITADAGTIVGTKLVGARQLQIRWTPPRLAFARKAVLRAKLRWRGRTFRSRHIVKLRPRKRTVTRARSSGPVALEAPASSVLGQSKSFVLRFKRVGKRAPRIVANVGSLSDVRLLPGNRAEMTYTLPREKFPQMAIFVAVDNNRRPMDWLAVPLFGQSQMGASTEPGAMVTAKVDGIPYGPIRANRAGHVKIGILVPPGVRYAETLAKDRLGNTLSKSIALGAPSYGQIATFCSTPGDRVFAVAVDRHGKALAKAMIRIRSARARFSAFAALPLGIVQSQVALDHTTQLGDRVKVITSLGTRAHARESSGSSCTLVVRGGPVKRVVVELGRGSYVAGTGKPVAITVRLTDAGGKPAQPAVPNLAVAVGSIRALRLDKGATYRALWTLPDRFAGRTAASVRARIGKIASAPATLNLRHGAVAQIRTNASRTAMPADGASVATLQVTAVDAHGNQAGASNLSFSARGRLKRRVHAGGTVSLRYTALKARRRTVDEIVIRDRATGVSTRVAMTLTPDLGRVVLLSGVGFMTNFGDLSGPTISAGAQVRAPVLEGRMFVRLQAGYGRSTTTENALMPAGEELTGSVTLLPVLVGAYVDVLTSPVTVYAGISGGAVYSVVGIESASTGRAVNTGTSFAFAGAAGTYFPLGPGGVNIELSQLFANVNVAPVDKLLKLTRLAAGYRLSF